MVTTNPIAKKEEKERQNMKCKKTTGISCCRQRNNPRLPDILENIPDLIKAQSRKSAQSIYVQAVRSNHSITCFWVHWLWGQSLEPEETEDGAKLFSVVPSNRTRGNGHKLKQRKLQLNPRKNFFPLRVTEPWPRLPREAVESPSLEMFQPRLAAMLCSLLWVTLLGRGLGWVTHRGPCQP